MRGELDFESSLRLRVSNFKGLDALNTWNYVRSKVSIRPGFCGLLRACKSICNIDIAVLSGGFVEMINEVASKIGCIDFTLSNMVCACQYSFAKASNTLCLFVFRLIYSWKLSSEIMAE